MKRIFIVVQNENCKHDHFELAALCVCCEEYHLLSDVTKYGFGTNKEHFFCKVCLDKLKRF